MANAKVSSQELDAILGELEGELTDLLTGTQTRLNKAREEDGSPSPGMSASAGGSPSAGGAPSGAPEGDPSMGGAPSAGGASPEGAPAGEPGMEGAPAGEPGMEGAPEGAPAGEPGMEGAPGGEQGAMDPQALEAEYAQLPLEELKAHYLAAKAALFAQMQGGGEQGGPPGAPPAGPSAGAPPPGPSAGAPPAGPSAGAPPPGAPPMAMSEGKAVAGVSQSGNGGQLTKKSEANLQAQVDALTKIVTAFVNKPMRKAITGDTYQKSEDAQSNRPMNSTEVTAKLSELTRSPDLKKSDRDLITGYYEGRTKLDSIVHLLK